MNNFEPSMCEIYRLVCKPSTNTITITRILDESPERDSRLALNYATAVVLKKEALHVARGRSAKRRCNRQKYLIAEQSK